MFWRFPFFFFSPRFAGGEDPSRSESLFWTDSRIACGCPPRAQAPLGAVGLTTGSPYAQPSLPPPHVAWQGSSSRLEPTLELRGPCFFRRCSLVILPGKRPPPIISVQRGFFLLREIALDTLSVPEIYRFDGGALTRWAQVCSPNADPCHSFFLRGLS